MDFRYGTAFGGETADAYERLLLDSMLGDGTLFARARRGRRGVAHRRLDRRRLAAANWTAVGNARVDSSERSVVTRMCWMAWPMSDAV
jgi:hypothetical protein